MPQIAPLAPFERRVVERFARGVQSVCEAVKSIDLATLVANANVGFGANACEQFADLIETTSPGGLDFSFSFSPEWMAPAEFIEPKEFSVGAVHVEVSRAAAKLMRTQFIPRSEYIVGRVVRLESDSDPSNLLNPAGRREIMIQWPSEDLGEILVKVPLDPEDYLRAVDAHAGGRVVTVSGTLEKRGRSWVLANPDTPLSPAEIRVREPGR